MHTINKEYNELFKFWVISCPEGCKITSWNEGDDILEYTSFEIAYCPNEADLDVYHCISIEDDKRLMELQLIEIEKVAE